jgi:hypothetical protein
MKKDYKVKVKDYIFHAGECHNYWEATQKIYDLIHRKKRLFKDYLNVKIDDYIIWDTDNYYH